LEGIVLKIKNQNSEDTQRHTRGVWFH